MAVSINLCGTASCDRLSTGLLIFDKCRLSCLLLIGQLEHALNRIGSVIYIYRDLKFTRPIELYIIQGIRTKWKGKRWPKGIERNKGERMKTKFHFIVGSYTGSTISGKNKANEHEMTSFCSQWKFTDLWQASWSDLWQAYYLCCLGSVVNTCVSWIISADCFIGWFVYYGSYNDSRTNVSLLAAHSPVFPLMLKVAHLLG